MQQAWDHIVVGAGSAGCLLAQRLTSAGRRVLLLEAGGLDRNLWIHLPVGYFKTIYNHRYSRLFDTEPSEGSGGRNIIWPRGRVLGGSSSINGLIYIRGQHADYDDWVSAGATGWDYPSNLPFFRRSERYEGGESEYHGSAGELGVSELRNNHPYCQSWLDAGMEFGLPLNPDFNASTDYGVGSYQLTLQGGWRASAARAFLRPALKRPQLKLVMGAQVSRLIIEGYRAVGVEWIENGLVNRARSESDVLLCAGALQSPQLLQLSGIGPGPLLRQHGINVLVNAPEVGQNLQDHYQARVVVRLKKKISLNDQVRSPLSLLMMGWQWLAHNRGPLTVGAGHVGGFAKTEYATNGRADVQFNVMPLSVDKPGDPLHEYSGFSASACQCRPASRGQLTIRSADPFTSPRIEPRYFFEQIDRKTIVAGLELLREIYNQPAFRNLWDVETMPGRELETRSQLWDFARNRGGTVFHPVGTCRMGSDTNAVLDPELRVQGVQNLRVIDASAMPTLTSANTNAPTFMIAERGAALLLNS
jgi:choline dehydrogenase